MRKRGERREAPNGAAAQPDGTEISPGAAGRSNMAGRSNAAGENSEALVKNVGFVMLISILARGLSLVGSMSYTRWFGYTLETDIYSYAINLPNLIFTCIGTALVTVVIPIFAGRLASGERERAYGFIDNIVTVSLFLSAVIAVAGILASPLVVRMIERFNTGDPALALFALRLMFPIVLFHAVTYILQGVLQSNGRFYLPAAVSAFSGLSVIVYVVFFAGRFGIKGLLAATFIGLASQALVLIPPVAGPLKYRYRPSLRLSDEDMRLAGKLALPVLVSSSSYQFNMFMNSTFAAGFEGGVITITNMQTLALTAAQLFILSTLSVFFPGMSASFATGDYAGLKNAFNKVIRLIIVFAVPASAALAYLSRFIIPLLYGYGKVTESDINISVTVFAIYALAIASIGFKEAADRAFYAVRDSRTPAAVSIIIMALNIALSILFMKFFGIAGLPAAYIVAITSGAAILLLLLRGKMRRLTPAADRDVPEAYAANSPTGSRGFGAGRSAGNRGLGVGRPAGSRGLGVGLVSSAVKCAVSTCSMLAALIITEILINTASGAQAGAIFTSSYGVPAAGLALRVAILTIAGGGVYAAVSSALGVAEMKIPVIGKIFASVRK